MSAVSKYFDEIKLFAEQEGLATPPKPEEAWLDFDEMKKRHACKSAVADTEPATLLPKVIMYDEVTGMPTSAQDVRVAPSREAIIASLPWKEWLRGRVAQHLCEKGDPHCGHPIGAPLAPYPWPRRRGSNRCQHPLELET